MLAFRRAFAALGLALLVVLPGLPASVDAFHRVEERIVLGVKDFAKVPPEGAFFLGARILEKNERAGFVVVAVSSPSALLAEAARDARVRYAERDGALAVHPRFTPDDPRASEQYALSRVRAHAAWDVTRGSTEVTLAVLDSGIQASHPDLARLKPGRDFTKDKHLNDRCGHGTHAAGIAAATLDNGLGIAGLAQVSVLPVKVLTPSWSGGCSGSFSALANGITWAADQGARVIAMSLGCYGCSSAAVKDAVAYAAGRGALIVAASGNNGPCSNCVDFPANLPDVMAVACTDSADARCEYASSGPEVEIAAPGHRILSTYPTSTYREMSGTSMSVPHVAAAAALLFSHAPGLSAADARAALVESARDLGPAGRDADFGYGRLDVAEALSRASKNANAAPVASFTATCDELACRFDATASRDPDGTIASYAWDFGDGATGTGARAERAYAAGGHYDVRLTVKDDEGAMGRAVKRVTAERAGTLLEETFNDGTADGWTLTGLWRVGAGCLGTASAPESLQFNRPAPCDYDTGARATGTATFTIDLTPKASPQLRYQTRYEVERYANGAYDQMRVEASADGGRTWTLLHQRDSRHAAQDTWAETVIDLTPVKSAATQLRFVFDTRDTYYNKHPGWAVDDVRVG